MRKTLHLHQSFKSCLVDCFDTCCLWGNAEKTTASSKQRGLLLKLLRSHQVKQKLVKKEEQKSETAHQVPQTLKRIRRREEKNSRNLRKIPLERGKTCWNNCYSHSGWNRDHSKFKGTFHMKWGK